jgi:hypothetical protein
MESHLLLTLVVVEAALLAVAVLLELVVAGQEIAELELLELLILAAVEAVAVALAVAQPTVLAAAAA